MLRVLKRRIPIIVVVSLIVVFLRVIVVDYATSTTAKSEALPENDAIVQDRVSTNEHKAYDILLNSYMRSGSSFTGRLLSFRKEAFYWYEPLWNYHSGVFYWGSDKICYDTHCGPAQPYGPSVRLHAKVMQRTLRDIYRCNFTSLLPAIAENMTDILSGESWDTYRQCRRLNRPMAFCAKRLELVCNQSMHRVTKVLRMTLDNIDDVLATTPKVKVVHLFRDPRATLNSRLNTDWYNLNLSPHDSHSRIRADAKHLCDRMLYDLKAGLDLKLKYPNRFAFIFYEDLMNNTKTKAKTLFSYFGINPSTVDVTLRNMTITVENASLVSNHSARQYSTWWRHQLPLDAINAIDAVCSDLYRVLGYRTMSNVEKLKDPSIPSAILRDEFLIEHFDRNVHYSYKV